MSAANVADAVLRARQKMQRATKTGLEKAFPNPSPIPAAPPPDVLALDPTQ